MGADLVSTCVFCAALLFGDGLPPRRGLGVEIGVSYSTLARRFETPSGIDGSDVTAKFLLVGLGYARAAGARLGAGTPELEWRARFAFAPSHDEQGPFEVQPIGQVVATGTGRFENFALLGRLPVGSRDSVEAAVSRRFHQATDLINLGGENNIFSEQRTLSAEEVDAAVGWRHRWRDFETAASVRYARPSSGNATAGLFSISAGQIFGAGLEARLRRGGWTFAVEARRLAGSIDVHEESQPDFRPRDFVAPARFESVRLGVGYALPRFDLFLGWLYDRSRLPFVAVSVLGTETVDFERGFHPDSRTRQSFYDLSGRYAFSSVLRAKLSVRLGWGSETVILTDSSGAAPPRMVPVRRGGVFVTDLSRGLGAPEATLWIGAEVGIGPGSW